MPHELEYDAALRKALADLIQRRQHEIEARWIASVLADIGARTIDPTELRDAIPHYLETLARELRSDAATSTVEMEGNAAWAPIAEEHAITRVRQGFDIEQLVHEFVLLRRTLLAVARENGLGDRGEGSILADLIEAAVAISVGTYVQSRDYAARQSEAEHIGFVTHEFKTPLTAAHIVAQRLRTELHLTESQAKKFDLLLRSLDKLRDLIDGVLLVERFEADQVEAHTTEVSVGDLLASPVEGARATAEAKGLRLEVDCDPAAVVHVDPQLTSSVLGNLIDNAIKYTDAGTVKVSCDATREGLEVHIRDNCPGLSREELATIFEPFQRGHHPHKPGAGLGLAIAKRAVQAQGGRIGAESPGERGCHFWFTLPCASSP